MKLASYIANNRQSFGVVKDHGIVDLTSKIEDAPDLKSLLARGLDDVESLVSGAAVDLSLDEVEYLPVIPNSDAMFVVGLNTQSHFDENVETLGRYMTKPDRPFLFMRTARAQVGHNQAMEKPNGTPLYDYEGEIAIVIGKFGRHIPEERALDYVAGYSCFNDGTLRDYQTHSPLFTAGKNFPRSGAFGPWLVTPDEVGPVEDLRLTTRVNGKVVQKMPYSDLLFSFPQLISYISEFSELHPGDVIVTGTPAGVGLLREPPLMLQSGDVCEVEVSGIGILRNTVVDAEGDNRAPVSRTDIRKAIAETFGQETIGRPLPDMEEYP